MLFAKDFLTDQQVLSSYPASSTPKVSIILPTYRRFKEGFLERSIRSVLAQTYQDYELLVMDDGSTDGSNELIERFRDQEARLIHVRHELNSGLPALRVNEGIELARGRYLAFQFDDDYWRPNALADLVSEAERRAEPAVIVGRALFSTRVGKHTLPAGDVDLVALFEQNRFANNSVLFPRLLASQYGMYDPHIGMRRLCDWDLWLRLARHVPFIVIDQIVSDVFESNTGAIGMTVPWDLPLFRFLNSIPRDQLLLLENWRDYQVDAMEINGVQVEGDIRRRLHEQQIVPFYFKIRHRFPELGGFQASLPQSNTRTVLYTKQSYDVSNDVTITHYDRLANQRGAFKTFYQPLGEVKPDWIQDTDLLLLMRTVEDHAVQLTDLALKSGKPVGLYLDDDLLHFHEFGSKFDYLAPGTPYYQNLSEIIKKVDAVLVTNDFIGDSLRELNPRLIPHNNTVPVEALPAEVHPRGSQLVRIGYVGSGYRIEEFKQIWDALLRISREYGNRLSFEFWGIDLSSLSPLSSPVVQRPFTFSYPLYLQALRRANFDILLTPMLDHPRPRLGKSLIKYYETAAAGALGIFSDVPQYQKLPGGLTCLKAENTVQGWYEALCQAIEMEPGEFDRMRKRCLEHVREEYSTRGQIDLHEAALRAVEFHAKTRSRRYQDGSPRVVYVLHSAHFGGAEIQLWRRLRLARRYGIQPIVVIPSVLQNSENGLRLRQELESEGIQLEAVEYTCFTEPRTPAEFFSDLERGQIRELLERTSPALVHTVTFIPSFGQICQEMKIPHVSTLYAIEDDFAWLSNQPDFEHCAVVQSDCLRYATRWSELLGAAKICARDMSPEELFLQGQDKHLSSIGSPLSPPAGARPHLVITGTFQERKQQLETIEAIGRLKREGMDCEAAFYGYTHFFPEYMEKCRQAIKHWGLEDRVTIHEYTDDIGAVLASAYALLSLSSYESFPGSIKDALAAGVLVVATPVGGIPEIIIDGVSGILCADTSSEAMVESIRRALSLSPPQREQMIEQARQVAREELHPYRAANDLFRMYNLALDLTEGGERRIATPAAAALLREASSARSFGRVASPTAPPSSHIQVGAGLNYQFTPGRPNWSGLDILVGTHMKPASGQLILKVHSPGGNVLRTVAADLSKARDNDWLEFRFPPIKNSAGIALSLEFMLLNPGPDTIISLYQNSPALNRQTHLTQRAMQKLGFQMRGVGLYCREWYS